MKSMRNVMLVSALVVLPSLALAQAGAAGAVTGATRINPPPAPAMPPPPPAPVLPPPTVQAGAAVNGAAAAATGVRPPAVSSPTAVTSSGGAQTAAGVSSTGVSGNAAANAAGAGAGQANGLNVAGNVNQNSSFAVNSAATVNEIQTASFTSRRELASSIEGRLDATQQTLAALRAKANAAGDSSRQAFTRAASDIRERERALRARLRATAGTTNDLLWTDAQSALVSDYSAYAQAVASAEAAAQGSASAGATAP